MTVDNWTKWISKTTYLPVSLNYPFFRAPFLYILKILNNCIILAIPFHQNI